MAQRRVKISRNDASRLRKLERELGDYTLRSLLTGGNQRLVRPDRLANLKAGRGKLQPWEHERLAMISRNAPALGALKEKREDSPLYSKRKKELSGKTRDRAVNKALRSWLTTGKEKDTPYQTQDIKTKKRQQKAIKALQFFGIDPTEKHYYVRKVAS